MLVLALGGLAAGARAAAALARRRGPAFALAVAPVLLWLLLFSSGVALLPPRARPRINTTLLPRIDALVGYSYRWFDATAPPGASTNATVAGATAPANISSSSRPVVDLLAAVPYTVHPILPFVYIAARIAAASRCGGSAAASDAQRPRILTFIFVFGVMNVAAVLTHLLAPTAPPWYFDKYGTAPASYDMKGDPAVLARVDALLGIQFFTPMYRDGGKVVFGAWPSLHAAWPFLMFIFRPVSSSRVVRLCMGLYVVWVWWAAMYLHHHFLADLLGGALYAQLAHTFATPKDSKGREILNPEDQEPLLPVTTASKRPTD